MPLLDVCSDEIIGSVANAVNFWLVGPPNGTCTGRLQTMDVLTVTCCPLFGSLYETSDGELVMEPAG